MSIGPSLAGLVDRWQDYANHLGGIASNLTNDHEIYFSGGFNTPITNATINQNRASVGLPPIPGGDRVPGGQGYNAAWEFRVSRLTGKLNSKIGMVKSRPISVPARRGYSEQLV